MSFRVLAGIFDDFLLIGPRFSKIRFGLGASATQTSTTVNALNEGVAVGLTASESFTASTLCYRVNSVTGSPGTLRLSIQGRSGLNGPPDGTVKGGGSPASTTVASHSAGINRVTLDNSYSVSVGEQISIVAEATAGTWDGSNSLSLFYGCGSSSDNSMGRTFNNGGSWSATGYTPMLSLGNGTRDYLGNCLSNIVNGTNYFIDANGSQREVALKFTVPNDNLTYTLVAFHFRGDHANGANATWTLYEGGAVSDTTSSYSDGTVDEEFGPETDDFWFKPLDTPQVLTNGTTYRASLLNDSNNITGIYNFEPADASALAAEQGNWALEGSHRQTGNWTDNTTQLPDFLMIMSVAGSAGGGQSGLILPQSVISRKGSNIIRGI